MSTERKQRAFSRRPRAAEWIAIEELARGQLRVTGRPIYSRYLGESAKSQTLPARGEALKHVRSRALFLLLPGTSIGLTVAALATAPSLARKSPELLLIAAPGIASIVTTWGQVSWTLACVLVAVFRMVKVASGYEAGLLQVPNEIAGSGLSRWLRSVFPGVWPHLLLVVSPSVGSGLAAGYLRRSRVIYLSALAGIAWTQASWFIVLNIYSNDVDQVGELIRRQSATTSATVIIAAVLVALLRRKRGRLRRSDQGSVDAH